MKFTRYAFTDLSADDRPKTRPETDGSVGGAAMYKAAGIEVPERPYLERLTAAWRTHRSGAHLLRGPDALYVFDR